MTAWTWTMLGVLLLGSACAESAGDDSPERPGQVTPPWEKYCVATFTAPFAVREGIAGPPRLQIHAGDRYLLGESWSPDAHELLYIADEGPMPLQLGNLDGTAVPFVSSCSDRATRPYIGVFLDTRVYSDADRTNLICTLPAGLAVPGGGVGYSFGAESGSRVIFRVQLEELAASCNDVATGFIATVHVTIGSITQFGLPIRTVLGPESL
jgi:hypothetical protein